MKLETILREDLKYSTEAIATDKELSYQVQALLTTLCLLDPPIDTRFGPLSVASLKKFQALMQCQESGFLGAGTAKMLIETKPEAIPKPPLKLHNNLAGRIIKYMLAKNYHIALGEREYNIVYVVGINAEGTCSRNAPEEFNDRRIILEVKDGVPVVLGNWEATIEPNHYEADNLISSGRVVKIKFGQHKAWQVGIHGTAEPHEALVQVRWLDLEQEFSRVGDFVDPGLDVSVNQHYGFDVPRNDVCISNGGSLVGRTRSGHREFMTLLKQDRRYVSNPGYIFSTTILPGNDLMQMFPA